MGRRHLVHQDRTFGTVVQKRLSGQRTSLDSQVQNGDLSSRLLLSRAPRESSTVSCGCLRTTREGVSHVSRSSVAVSLLLVRVMVKTKGPRLYDRGWKGTLLLRDFSCERRTVDECSGMSHCRSRVRDQGLVRVYLHIFTDVHSLLTVDFMFVTHVVIKS